VLLVANHPNSLLDPVLVQAVAGRPVRFLAKAPLFTDAKVGWLVRGAGAIPVFRAADDPAQMGRNEDTFRAVHAALAGCAAVGIFPEGLSHLEPGLAPLRTGAARIALGVGRVFPVVPVGLVFRAKDVFRSDALVLVGEPVPWDDLAPRGIADAEAVRDLTARIDATLPRDRQSRAGRTARWPSARCASGKPSGARPRPPPSGWGGSRSPRGSSPPCASGAMPRPWRSPPRYVPTAAASRACGSARPISGPT
jgi:1-acyl-sn-glycerol-3-phosphate acyltransferase